MAPAETDTESKEKEEVKIPEPNQTYSLTFEEWNAGVERFYFWILDFLKNDLEYTPDKTQDWYTASEASAFWGNIESRKGMQQEKVHQYLMSIGALLQELWKILRDIRIQKERLRYYEDAKKGDESAEIALKALWIDRVEGGAKNPGSVYGLSSQVGFITLPDLFFKITPKSGKDVDKAIESMKGDIKVNRKVREVLGRKLKQYILWRDATEEEIKTKQRFMKSYLAAHFHKIRMYMSWIKPYLKNIEALQMMPTAGRPEIITAAEGAIIQLELLAKKEKEVRPGETPQYVHPVITVEFIFRTSPQLVFTQEYQKGAGHTGRTEIIFKSYAMNDEEIEAYKKKKTLEDFEILAKIDESMNAFKDELYEYLKEIDEEQKEGKNGKKKSKIREDISRIFKPVKRFREKRKKKKTELSAWQEQAERNVSGKKAKDNLWLLYDTFKSAFKMVRW